MSPCVCTQVTVDSVAFKAGLVAGDVIQQICDAPTRRMTHEQAKMEIIRAGNELDFFVHRSQTQHRMMMRTVSLLSAKLIISPVS